MMTKMVEKERRNDDDFLKRIIFNLFFIYMTQTNRKIVVGF